MATTTQRSRFVAESCFDYLNLVMADTIFNASERSEVAVSKLETLGFRVGQKLIERYTVDRLRFNEKIDIIKFICREFWMTLFQKQVDSLRTNRKGVFVLTDNKFRWITSLSAENAAKTKQLAEKYLVFPCGLIKGALDVLGVPCIVKAEITNVPQCTFTVTLKPGQ